MKSFSWCWITMRNHLLPDSTRKGKGTYWVKKMKKRKEVPKERVHEEEDRGQQ